ncbi:MAG TPA: DUF1684 domain-containing protein [Cyclobacteriaceae bacterium]|nr:DUF1684 domain-containing protein [Cyclobacteriaceae bacterium]
MKYILLSIFVLILSCSPQKENTIDRVTYENEINAWHANRVATQLVGDNGWLNLAGLYWLKEGFNTFGSDPSNDVVFPEGKMVSNAGTFVVQQGKVIMEVNEGVEIMKDSIAVNHEVIHIPDSSFYPVMSYGTLEWLVIDRSGKLGVRVRDLESEAVKNFTGVERYPIDPKWRVEAKWEKYEPLKHIAITNILGQTYQSPCPGALVFTIDGVEYRLDAIDDGTEGEYYILFGDKTNETETYPSGRYMYVKYPDGDGKVIVDFNKSYNPPCAFTEFATCPLPPKQNGLDLTITAGEKNFGHH